VIRFGSVLASVCMNLLFYLKGILLVIVATTLELSTFFFLGGGGVGKPAWIFKRQFKFLRGRKEPIVRTNVNPTFLWAYLG